MVVVVENDWNGWWELSANILLFTHFLIIATMFYCLSRTFTSDIFFAFFFLLSLFTRLFMLADSLPFEILRTSVLCPADDR